MLEAAILLVATRIREKMPSGKIGKNEAKRAEAEALKDLDSEMTEEERERMLRKGMGVDMGGALQTGELRLTEKKMTKEEKKAQTEARRAALAERKAQEKAMKDAIAANRKAAEGGDAEDGDGGGGEGGSYAQNYGEGDGETVDVSESAGPTEEAKPKAAKAKAGSSSKGTSTKKGKEASSSKKQMAQHKEVDGVLAYQFDDMPFFERSGPSASKRKSMSMDIKIGGIRMCAGKQELLDSAVLALNYGVKYGLVGRNGVGKVRACAAGVVTARGWWVGRRD